jgi:predicted nucleic-acid-binding protein
VLAANHGFNAHDWATAIDMLLYHRDFVLEDSDALAKALDLFRRRPPLGFADCLMLELARKAGGLPLGTFDRKLGRADGTQKI